MAKIPGNLLAVDFAFWLCQGTIANREMEFWFRIGYATEPISARTYESKIVSHASPMANVLSLQVYGFPIGAVCLAPLPKSPFPDTYRIHPHASSDRVARVRRARQGCTKVDMRACLAPPHFHGKPDVIVRIPYRIGRSGWLLASLVG